MNDQHLPYQIIRYQSRNKPSDRFIFNQTHHTSLRNKSVTLICCVEIANQWHSAREGTQTISTQLIREFNRNPSTSLITRFESCLKSLNETIISLRDKVDGQIDIFIAAVYGQEIHFSTIGSPKLFLVSGQGLSNIISESESKESRTFSAVTSGDLSDNDILICGSSGFKETLNKLSGFDWVIFDEQKLHNDLTSLTDPLKLAAMSALLLKFDPTPPHQKTFYWEENEQRLPSLKIPHLKFRLKFPHLTVKNAAVLAFSQKVTKFFNNFWSRFRPARARTETSGIPARRIWPIFVTIIFLIALGFGATLIRKNVTKSLTSDPPPKTLVEELSQTTASDILTTLKEKYSLAAYDSLSDSQKTDWANLLLQRGISYLPLPTVTVEYPNPIIRTATFNNIIYALDETGQLWRWDGKVNLKIDQTALVVQPQDLALIDEQKIVVSDVTGNVWLFSDQPTKPLSLALPTKLASGPKKLAVFGKNLYLQINDGTVYKVANFVDKLDTATVAVKAGIVPFTQISDWKIDGDYYFLSTTGRLVNVSKGKLAAVDLALAPILAPPQLLTTAQEIITASDQVIWRHQLNGTSIKTYFIGSDKPVGDLSYLSSGDVVVTLANKLYLLKLN